MVFVKEKKKVPEPLQVHCDTWTEMIPKGQNHSETPAPKMAVPASKTPCPMEGKQETERA